MAEITSDPISQVTLSCPDQTTVQSAVPPSGAMSALISIETNATRITFSGETPVAAGLGQFFPVTTVQPYFVPCADTIKAVAITATSKVNITWLG